MVSHIVLELKFDFKASDCMNDADDETSSRSELNDDERVDFNLTMFTLVAELYKQYLPFLENMMSEIPDVVDIAVNEGGILDSE
jgi:hypothetical protein